MIALFRGIENFSKGNETMKKKTIVHMVGEVALVRRLSHAGDASGENLSHEQGQGVRFAPQLLTKITRKAGAVASEFGFFAVFLAHAKLDVVLCYGLDLVWRKTVETSQASVDFIN